MTLLKYFSSVPKTCAYLSPLIRGSIKKTGMFQPAWIVPLYLYNEFKTVAQEVLLGNMAVLPSGIIDNAGDQQ